MLKLTKGDAVKYIDPESGLLGVLIQSGWTQEQPKPKRTFLQKIKVKS